MPRRSRAPMLSASDWDIRYQRCPDAYGIEANSFLVEAARHVPVGSRVLLLGEGEGRNALFLRESRNAKCVAVDWSQVATSRCRRRGIEAICSDVVDLPDGLGQFDCLVVIFCAPVGLGAVLRNAFARLRPGGIAIIELFADFDARVGPSANRICDAEGVVAELEGGLVVSAETKSRVVLEGTYHASLDPRRVTQVVVRASQPHSSFLAKMDAVFSGDFFSTTSGENFRSRDAMLGASRELFAASVAAMDGCRYCWAAPSCRCQPASRPWASRVVVLSHPNEFLRSTSTGRLLASVCGAQLKLFGEELPPDYKILYPSEDAVDFFDDGSTLIVVPDGSWKQAEAMMKVLPSGRSVRLRHVPTTASSDVMDALYPGAGKGRLSTLEAVALALDVDPRSVLAPFVDSIRRRRQCNPSSKRSVPSSTLSSLQKAARNNAPPPDNPHRFCPLCSVTLASPHRMAAHVAGKQHCTNVALLWKDEIRSDNADHVFRMVSKWQPEPRIEPPDAAVSSVLLRNNDNDRAFDEAKKTTEGQDASIPRECSEHV